MLSLPSGRVIAIDTETTGLDPFHGARVFCWAYQTEKGEYGFMPKTPANLDWLCRLFSDPSKTIVMHKAAFDLKMLSFEGVEVLAPKARVYCTMILAKLFNSMWWEYGLRYLALKLLNRSSEDKDEIETWLKQNKRQFVVEHGREPTFQDAPLEIVKRRVLWDVESTLRLFLFLFPRVKKQVGKTLIETERQLMHVVVDMELHGVEVDITRARQLKADAQRYLMVLQHELDNLVCPLDIHRTLKKRHKKTGETVLFDEHIHIPCQFNPASPIEMPEGMKKLEFELKYKTKPKKGKKGGAPTGGGRWSFDEYAMIRYSTPAVAKIIKDSGEEGWTFDRWCAELRKAAPNRRDRFTAICLKRTEYTKMISTYYDHIIDRAVDVRIDADGHERGVLHCTFNQAEAMTGRFSSSEPNLQNMPRLLGPRECFVPRWGRRHWHFDYEQVEMKFFVHFAKDDDMRRAIEGDIHEYVAAQLYSVAKPSKEQRKRAKGVNFGILYGSGPGTMAETLTKKGLLTTKNDATYLCSNYHRRFPCIRRLTNELKIELHRKGFVRNPFGRCYHIDTKFAYRALNYMCQGTSADQIKAGMVKVWLWLRAKSLKSKIIMQIHDELVLEVPADEEAIVFDNVKQIMQDVDSFYVPITVDAEVVSERWSHKEKPEKFIKKTAVREVAIA